MIHTLDQFGLKKDIEFHKQIENHPFYLKIKDLGYPALANILMNLSFESVKMSSEERLYRKQIVRHVIRMYSYVHLT